MNIPDLCRAGIEARDLSFKDRVHLQARVHVMIINATDEDSEITEKKILEYIRAYRSEFRIEPVSLGREFSLYMGRLGYLAPLVAALVHYAR